MAFEYRDKDQLVLDVLNAIQSKLPFEIDTSVGDPLRTIIEAIMQETHLQYWQLEQIYNGSFIDTSYGDDLSELVKILGITRIPGKQAYGYVLFKRETPANLNYFIPSGTLVQTLPDRNGLQLHYRTSEDSLLEIGETEVLVPILAVETGKNSNVVANSIVVINDPPQGIESVTNPQAIIGGEEEETDEELRTRTKNILDTTGNATIPALQNRILELDGIRQVNVLDMERGIGTVDILILGDIVPLPDYKKTEIENIISKTKSGGIDIQYFEPDLISQNVEIVLNLKAGIILNDTMIDKIEKTITDYVNNLNIGETLIKNQLERHVLNVSSDIIDLNVINPINNVTPLPREVIRINNITIS